MKKATKASQEQTATTQQLHQDKHEPSLRAGRSYSTEDVRRFVEEARQRKRKDGQPFYKAAQIKVLESVSERVCTELHEEACNEDYSEPFMRLMHGGPGVGKSETIKLIKKLFTDVLHWNIGIDFQLAAHQAVMAEQLGGDTLHHACGISFESKKKDQNPQTTRNAKQKLRSLYCSGDGLSSTKLVL